MAYRSGKGDGRFDDLKSASAQIEIGHRVAYARQVHSRTVIVVDSAGLAGEGDGLITDNREVVVAIQVADCIPIFVAEKGGEARGLVHAGWRGSTANIAGKGIESMVSQLGADATSLRCLLGPSIQSCCYEIGEDVAEKFQSRYLTECGGNRYTLDLHSANLDQLIDAGVKGENISFDRRCTSCSGSGLHSFRRDGEKAGRNICYLG